MGRRMQSNYKKKETLLIRWRGSTKCRFLPIAQKQPSTGETQKNCTKKKELKDIFPVERSKIIQSEDR